MSWWSKLFAHNWLMIEARPVYGGFSHARLEVAKAPPKPSTTIPVSTFGGKQNHTARESWASWFMRVATLTSSRSKDPRTKVGAVAVRDSNDPVASGYNGLPRGVMDLPERMDPSVKYDWFAHAEANLVAHAARPVLEGTTVYVTHKPCAQCAALMINAGVKRIVYGPGQTNMPVEKFVIATTMCCEAGVTLEPAA